MMLTATQIMFIPNPTFICKENTHCTTKVKAAANGAANKIGSGRTISDVLMPDAEQTMALGGVATGNMNAYEQESVTGNSKYNG